MTVETVADAYMDLIAQLGFTDVETNEFLNYMTFLCEHEGNQLQVTFRNQGTDVIVRLMGI